MMYRTVFISDLHLGGACNYEALLKFLHDTDADTWYIVGDFIDFWAIKRTRSWPTQASLVIQKLLRKARKGQRIIVLPGNHDSELRSLENFQFGNVEIVETAIYELGTEKFLVLHGDVFDSVIGKAEWLAKFGAVAYDFLVSFNTNMNWIRKLLGLPFWSFSAAIKRMVKRAVSYVSDFEDSLTELAKQRGAGGVICGHIHTPADKMVQMIRYLNCGDWVESRTALVESEGKLELIYL